MQGLLSEMLSPELDSGFWVRSPITNEYSCINVAVLAMVQLATAKLINNYQRLMIMKLLIIVLISVYYLLMAQRFFKIWRKFFERDTSMSPEEKRLSWIILIVGSVFWPIVVPNSYLALIEKKLVSKEAALKRYEAT